MPNVTVSIPDDLKEAMGEHEEVNGSAVIRNAIHDHLRTLAITEAIAKKSKLTRQDLGELDRLVKKGIADGHGLR